MAKVSTSAIRHIVGWTDYRGMFNTPDVIIKPYTLEAYRRATHADICYAIRELGTNQLVAKDLTKEEADAMMKILPQEIE